MKPGYLYLCVAGLMLVTSPLSANTLPANPSLTDGDANTDVSKPSTNNLSTSMPSVTLDALTIDAHKTDAEVDYVGVKATALLKSNETLFDTAKSVSVITKEQLEQKQATTLSEALRGVSGVTTGQYGRRGRDDFIIRGQLANSQVMIDGMRSATSKNFLNSFDVSGLESVEVIKGIDSVGFGPLMPSGVVNLTTKKPKANSFQEVSVLAGSYGLLQGAFDVNYANDNNANDNNANAKSSTKNNENGAFRVNGRVAYSDDPTDYVYFKNVYLAPSYRFKPNDKLDLTLLGSYQGREYVRQQGLPVQDDTYKKYKGHVFFGDPNRYLKGESMRLGYQLAYNVSDDWRLKQNFAFTKREADGQAVVANGIKPMQNSVMNRRLNDQLKKDTIFSLDTQLNRLFKNGNMTHNVLIGLDGFYERSDYDNVIYNYSKIDLSNPDYDSGNIIGNPRANSRYQLNHTNYLGLYAKDSMWFPGFSPEDSWGINLGGRYDWSQVKSQDKKIGKISKNADNEFTANASVMYQWHGLLAPYVSYATSFLPTTNTGENGELLEPEKGKQLEFGVKLQSLDKRLQGSLSYYDLIRKNVSETFNNETTKKSYGIAVGEQRTKGYEAEIKAVLNDQWNVLASYSYIPTAKIVNALNGSNYYPGQRINHVPKNAYTLGMQYHMNPNQQGWQFGATYRYEDEHFAERGAAKVRLPSYHLLDLETGYNTTKWRAGLSIQNVFDKEYYSGTSPNASMVTYGDPRTYRLKLTYKF